MASASVDCRLLTQKDKDMFVEEMLPYVKYLAYEVVAGLPPSVDVDDLVNYGVIGLLNSMKRYDHGRGIKFKSYAEGRVRGAMLDGLRETDWVPRSVRKQRRELERAYREVEQNLLRPAAYREVAKHMGMGLRVQGLSLGSLEEVRAGLDKGKLRAAMMYVDDESSDPYLLAEKNEQRKILAECIGGLPEKERKICSLYYYEELTMKEIGDILGIKVPRVSQLHARAVLRLEKRLRAKLNYSRRKPEYSSVH